ncbi:MAG: hypothetical protein KDI46_02185, partial [Alphaproteobacteria bacterium]|nr:hypothetical protein [Alphaproteobacteria bacterium]
AERYGSDWKQHWKEHQDDPLVQAWLRDKARLDDLRTQDNGLTTELHKLQRERDDLQQQSDSIEGQIKVQQARADRGDLEAAAKVEALKREGDVVAGRLVENIDQSLDVEQQGLALGNSNIVDEESDLFAAAMAELTSDPELPQVNINRDAKLSGPSA